MKFPSKNSFILLVFLALFIIHTREQCQNLCYTHIVQNAVSCRICYFQCPHSTEVAFTSCSYQNEKTQQFKDLTESQCFTQCYPQKVQEVSVVSQLSQKLTIQVEPLPTKQTNLHKITQQELKKQLQKQRRDFDFTVFGMVVGCALFTIIAIIVILKHFDFDDEEKSTIRTNYTNQEDKDLPDINPESASSYMEQNEQIPRKVIL